MARKYIYLLQKQKNFLARKNLNQHLVDTFSEDIYNGPLHPYSQYLPKGQITPDLIKPEAYRNSYEWLIKKLRLQPGVCVWGIAPLMGFPWMEAILGCSIVSSDDGLNVWVKPLPNYGKYMEYLDSQSSNPWLEKLLEFTEYLVRIAKNRLPVNIFIMRGITDLLSAMMGPETLGLELYDHPEMLKKWASLLAELWIKVIKEQLKIIPRFHNHYWNMGLAFSKKCAMFQEDASAFLSPQMYKKMILASDLKVFAAFPYTIIHLHSSSLHILDFLLDRNGPSVIQVGVDSDSSIQKLIPIFQKVQQHKPLYISLVNSSVEDIQKVIDLLPPIGVILGIPNNLCGSLTGISLIYKEQEEKNQ